MLNFINNKFVKIFLLKTVVLSNLIYDVFCGCLIGEKNDTEKTEKIDNTDTKGKKGYCDGICGEGNSGQSDIDTDTSTDGNSNITNDNGVNDGGYSNNNDENLIKNKKNELLKILEEIKNDNKYLSDKIEEQDINILKDKIENLNNNNTSNIENELKDLRSTINLKLEKIKNNHIDTVVDIINSIEILENCYKEKYKLPKYTLNIDEVNNKKFNEIKDLNDTLERIKKDYDNLINKIVSNLKSDFDRLKNEKSNIKGNKLDVKDDDFNDLTEPTKIIDIDKKLFIHENIINNNKDAFIKKINEKYEELEKNKYLITSLLNKKDFNKPSDLDNKNINDLIKIYKELSNIDNVLLVEFNDYKKEQQKKYIELNDVYNKFKDIFNFNFEVTINFNEYDLDDYEDLIEKINNFENSFKDNISNIKENYENRINELIEKYKTKGYTINIDINIDNLDPEKQYERLEKVKKEIELREKSFQYFIDKSITKEHIEAIYENVDEIANYSSRNTFFGILLNELELFKIDIDDDLEKDFDTIYKNIVNNNDDIKNKRIQFEPKNKDKNKAVDCGGLRRQKFEEFKNYILQNIKFYKFSKKGQYDSENFEYIKDDKESNLFCKNRGYDIDSLYEKDIDKVEINYNFFTKFNDYTKEDYRSYYKCLAFLCGTSVRYIDYCPLNINLSPVIYKIMLDFDFNCDLDDKKNVCDNLKKIITYDDLKYGYNETYKILPKDETDLTIFNNEEDMDLIIEGYDNFIEEFFGQIKLIKLYYDSLKEYIGNKFFNDFKYKVNSGLKKYSHLILKFFLEGKNVNKPDDIIKIIDVNKCLESRYLGSKFFNSGEIINEQNAEFIIECFKDTLQSFDKKQIKKFLIWLHGAPTLPQSIHFEFVNALDYTNNDICNCSLLSSHTCFSYFDISVATIKEKINKTDVFNYTFSEDDKAIIKEYFKNELSQDIKNIHFSKA